MSKNRMVVLTQDLKNDLREMLEVGLATLLIIKGDNDRALISVIQGRYNWLIFDDYAYDPLNVARELLGTYNEIDVIEYYL